MLFTDSSCESEKMLIDEIQSPLEDLARTDEGTHSETVRYIQSLPQLVVVAVVDSTCWVLLGPREVVPDSMPTAYDQAATMYKSLDCR